MKVSSLFLRLVVISLILTVSLAVGGWERGEFMFLDEIQPGMQGICKTVVKGNTISTFNFEVVDVIRLPKDDGMILIRTWGDPIEESGGISAGMSGSPCYICFSGGICNKLIGAIFAVYVEDGFHDIADIEGKPHALVQPIEYMLQILDACKQGREVATAEQGTAENLFGSPNENIPVESITGRIKAIKVLSPYLPPEDLEAASGTLFIRRLTTPVMVSGLSERAFGWLKSGVNEKLMEGNKEGLFYIRGEEVLSRFSKAISQGMEEKYDLQLYRMGASAPEGAETDPLQLEPGSPIGGALMLDDIRSGAFGTVTYIEDQCLIAFGHYFLTAGAADIPMTAVSVLDTIKNVKSPFKLGFMGAELGSIVEDRFQAIGGAIGATAKTIQLNFKVADKDSGDSEEFRVRSVNLPDWHWYNTFIAGIEAVDQTLNRIGQGTLNLSLTIKGAGMPKPLERQDIFVSEDDISATALLDPAWIDFLLAWNEFADPQIGEINVEMSVEKALRVKVIEDIEPDQDIVEAGGELCYTVTLQPYRQPQEPLQSCITVPDWASGDIVALEAFPARDAFWKFEMSGPWVRPTWLWPQILNLEELIEAIEGAPSNDLMIVTVWSAMFGPRAVYDFDVISVGDWVVDGDRQSEHVAEIEY